MAKDRKEITGLKNETAIHMLRRVFGNTSGCHELAIYRRGEERVGKKRTEDTPGCCCSTKFALVSNPVIPSIALAKPKKMRRVAPPSRGGGTCMFSWNFPSPMWKNSMHEAPIKTRRVTQCTMKRTTATTADSVIPMMLSIANIPGQTVSASYFFFSFFYGDFIPNKTIVGIIRLPPTAMAGNTCWKYCMALKALTTAVATYDKIVRAAATPATFFEVVFSRTFTSLVKELISSRPPNLRSTTKEKKKGRKEEKGRKRIL